MLRLLPVLAATKLRDRVKATYGNPSDYYRRSRYVIQGQWVVVLPIGVAPPRSYAPYTVSLTAM